ncbi:MAG TPA: 30S ribosomal protein S17 [Candidatus Dormibacteraeota bacterium]|nr:30S ribosomal protein S17 [Candidatus Dormibacteraeota bacterium]
MTAEEGAAEADPTLGEGEAEWERPRRKAREGVVVSDRMDKTVVVVVRERKPHPLYKKVVQHRARFKAHDEDNACGVGDRVRIVETRPLSRDKRWRVAEILEKAK